MGSASDVAVRMLDAHFGAGPSRAGPVEDGAVLSRERSVPLWSYQAEGLDRVWRIIGRRGGAILADSVGLGKTHVALALVAEHLESGGDSVIVVPAALRAFWRRKLRLVRAPRTRLISHTQLARGFTVPPPAGARLVVVDEAHRFRNPRTLRYAALSRLLAPERRVTSGAREEGTGARDPAVRALFVTATPVNNDLDDLLHLLRLFAADDGFRDQGVASLEAAFESARRAGRGELRGCDGGVDSPVARVVRATVVRRTRAMVRARFDELGAFPRRALPRVVPYADPLTRTAVRQIEELELPLYGMRDGSVPDRGSSAGGPGDHPGAGPPVAGGAAALIRIGLLKRLDSSRQAFGRSVARLRSQTRIAADAVAADRLPDLAAGRPVAAATDPLQLVLVEVVSRRAPPGIDLAPLAAALGRDLERLDRLLVHRGSGVASQPGPAGGADPKLDALVRLLDHSRGERTLVFTEYRDTARAIWLALTERFQVGRIDGSGAWLGRQAAGRRVVVERFAPGANGRRRLRPRERVEVLVATDVLAEGLNLQDARHVVSYDLPWNPVRLLQRIGRIDRAGSPHEQIVPYLFAPAAGLDEALGLTRRLKAKLAGIEATVGAEHADVLLDALLDDLAALEADVDGAGIPSVRAGLALTRMAGEIDQDDDPHERLRTLWIAHREGGRRRPAAANGDPSKSTAGDDSPATATIYVDRDSAAAGLAWVIALRVKSPDRASAMLLEVNRRGRARRAGTGAAHVLQTALAEERGATGACSDVPGDFPWQPVRDFLLQDDASAAAPAPVSLQDPAGRLAGRLRRALARAPGLDPDLLTDADGLLADLATPQPPHTVARLHDLLERLDGSGPGPTGETPRSLIREARSALEHRSDGARRAGRSRGNGAGEHRMEMVGALRVVTLSAPGQPGRETPCGNAARRG